MIVKCSAEVWGNVTRAQRSWGNVTRAREGVGLPSVSSLGVGFQVGIISVRRLSVQVPRAGTATAGKRPPVKDWHCLGVAMQGVCCGLYVGSAPAIHSAHTFRFPRNIEQLMMVSVLRALYAPSAWLAL